MECLNKDANKKKGQIQYIIGRDDQIATSAIIAWYYFESYGFSGDLIETIT